MFQNKASIRSHVLTMNECIKSSRDSKVKMFTHEEFLVCLGVMIGAAEFEHQGKKCWQSTDHHDDHEVEYHSLVQHPNFDRFIPYSRFKEFRRFLPSIFENEQKRQAEDPWWKFCSAVDTFNSIRRAKIKKVIGLWPTKL